jgi:DNA-binding NtrC family response regulator
MARARVLIVEDDEAVRTLLMMQLVGEGYDVAVAESPGQARKVDLSRIDVIVSDVMMPDESGTEFKAWVEANHPNVGVVLTSAGLDGPPGTISKADWPYGILDAVRRAVG